MKRRRIFMEQRFKAAVFDLDGTLLDTSVGVLASVKYTIDYFGFAPLSDEQLRRFIGPPIQNSFANAYGLEGDILQEIAGVFRDRYKDIDLLKAVPYEGIFDVFSELNKNGIVPAIATYKREDYAITLLKHYGFDRYTDIMYGGDHENRLKKKDIIEKALIDAGAVDFSTAVMIGDSDNDAIGAEEIGCQFVGVTYGFGFHTTGDVNKYPNVGVADNTKELARLLIGE